MAGVDETFAEQARPHLADALTTFGFPNADPWRAVEDVAEAAEAAGFSDRDCWRLRDWLNEFIDLALRRALDPCSLGQPEPDPRALFAPDRLGGLFVERPPSSAPPQLDLFGEPALEERALIDQLIAAPCSDFSGGRVKRSKIISRWTMPSSPDRSRPCRAPRTP